MHLGADFLWSVHGKNMIHFYRKCGFRYYDVFVKPTEGGIPGDSCVYRKEMAANTPMNVDN